jgi:hypothetical protein
MSVRYKVKRGAQENLAFTFDVTNLPSGSLANLTIEWYVKRTLSQPTIDLFKTSVSGSIVVTNSSLGTGYIALVQNDTINKVPGDYLWGFKLYDSSKTVVALSPDQSNGDLVLLDSPASGLV